MKVIGKITSIQDGEFLLRGINGKTRPLKEGEQVMEGEVVYSSESNEPIANISLLLTDGTTLFLNDGDGLVLVETEIEKFKARFTEKDTESGEEESEDEGILKAKFDIRSGDIADVISAGVKAVYTTDAKVSEEFTKEVKRDSILEVYRRGNFENSNSRGNNSQTERVPENVFENEEEKDITPDTKPIIIPETPKIPEKSKEPEVPEIPEVLPSGKATLHSNQVEEGQNILIYARVNNSSNKDLFLNISDGTKIVGVIKIPVGSKEGYLTLTNPIENTVYSSGTKTLNYYIESTNGGNYAKLELEGVSINVVEKTDLTKITLSAANVLEKENIEINVSLENPTKSDMYLTIADGENQVVGLIEIKAGESAGKLIISNPYLDNVSFKISNIQGGGFEKTDSNHINIKVAGYGTTTLKVDLTAESVKEGEDLTIKAELDYKAVTDITLTIKDETGDTVGHIIIKAGENTGILIIETDKNPYVGGTEKEFIISDVNGGTEFKNIDISDKVNVRLTDGEEVSKIILSSETLIVNEGESITIKAVVPKTQEDMSIEILKDGESIGYIIILKGETEGTLTYQTEKTPYINSGNKEIEIGTVTGGGFEKVDDSDSLNIKVNEGNEETIFKTEISKTDVTEGENFRVSISLDNPVKEPLTVAVKDEAGNIKGYINLTEGESTGYIELSIPSSEYKEGLRSVKYTTEIVEGGSEFENLKVENEASVNVNDGVLETIINLRADNVEEGESVEVIASINKAPKEDLIISVRDSKGELKNILIEAGKFSGKILFDSFADDAYIQGERTISYEIESVNLNFENLTKNGTSVKIDDNETAVNFTISKEERISDLIINHTAAAETTENTGKLGLFLYQSKSSLEYQYNYYKKGAYSGANFQIPLGLKDDDFNIVVEKEIKQDENGYYYEVKIVKDTPIKITTEFTFTENSSYSKLGAIKETMNEGETEVVFKNYLTDDFLNDRMIKNKNGSYTDENGHTVYKEGLENVMGSHHEFYSSIHVSNSLINNYTMVSSLQFNIAGDLEINTTKIELETIDKGEQIEISLTSSDKYLSNNGFFMVIFKNEEGEIIKEYPLYLKQYQNGEVGEIGFYEKYEVKTYPSYLIDKSDFLGKGVVSYEIQLLTDYLDTARYNSDIKNRVYEDITYSSGTLNFGKEYLYKIQSEINPNISNPTVTVEITYKDGRTENRTVNLTSSGYAELKLNEEVSIRVINSNAGFENENSSIESKIGNLVISSINEAIEGEDIEIILSIDKTSSKDIYVYLQDTNNNEVGVVVIKAGDLNGTALIKNEFKDNIFVDGDRNMKVSIKDVIKGDFTKINYDSKDILIKDNANEIKGNLLLDIYENRINPGSLNTSYINNGTLFQGINGWVDINKSGESTLVVFDYKNELKVENNIISGKNLMFELPYQIDSTKIGIEFEKIIDGMKVSFFNSYQTKGITGYAILNIETEGIKINYYDRDNKLYKTEYSNISNTIYFDSENKEYNNYLKNFGDSDSYIKNKTRLGYISIESDEKIEVKGLFIKNEAEVSNNSYVLRYELETAPKTDLTLKIEDDKGVFVGDIIIKAGEKSGTLVLDKQEVGERTFKIKETIGGNYENLNKENEVSIDVKFGTTASVKGDLDITYKTSEFLPFEETAKSGLASEVYLNNKSFIKVGDIEIKDIFVKDAIMKYKDGKMYSEIVVELKNPTNKDLTFKYKYEGKEALFEIKKGETKAIFEISPKENSTLKEDIFNGSLQSKMELQLNDNGTYRKISEVNVNSRGDSKVDTLHGKIETEINGNYLKVKVITDKESYNNTTGVKFTANVKINGTIHKIPLTNTNGESIGTKEIYIPSIISNGKINISFDSVSVPQISYQPEDFVGGSVELTVEKLLKCEIAINEDISDKFDFITTFPQVSFIPYSGATAILVNLDKDGKAILNLNLSNVIHINNPTIEGVNFKITSKNININEIVEYEKEIIEPVKIKLSAEKEVIEGESIEITATINKAPENDYHITLSNGAIITILAGELSGSTIITNPFIDDNIVSDTTTGNDRKINLTISSVSDEFDYLDKNSKLEIKVLENDFPVIKEGTAELISDYGSAFNDYLKKLDFNDSGDKLLYKGLEINFAKLEDLNNDGTANNAVLDLTWKDNFGYNITDNLKNLSIKDVLNLSDGEGIIKIKLDGEDLGLKNEFSSDSDPDIISQNHETDSSGDSYSYQRDSISFNKDENWVATKTDGKEEYVFTTSYEDKELKVIVQVPDL